jgi:haloacetate dehalogenase
VALVLLRPARQAGTGDPRRPDAWYRGSPGTIGEQAYAEYREAIHDPATVRAMLEDYRAGPGVDRADDEAERAAGRRVACPLLVLWSLDDDLEVLYGDPLRIWRDWATDLRGGHAIGSGHHMAEEAPDELVDALTRFLGGLAFDRGRVTARRGPSAPR